MAGKFANLYDSIVMKQLNFTLFLTLLFSLIGMTGCICFDGGSITKAEGVLVNTDGKPLNAWVGVTSHKVTPENYYGTVKENNSSITKETRHGLAHTQANGRFEVVIPEGLTWGGMLIFGFIPYPPGCTKPPVHQLWENLYLHIHDENGWRTICVPVHPEQQDRSKPPDMYVKLGKVVVGPESSKL